MAELNDSITSNCRVCGADQGDNLGPIFHPQPATVAGVPIDLRGMEFHLLRCEACGFQFKHPPIPQDRLLACYEEASASHWKDDPDPYERQFDVLRDAIEQHAPLNMSEPRRILDVGCFNGAILDFLGPKWDRFGVEPSIEAAQRAQQRGVTILGRTIDDLSAESAAVMPFDCILLIDVIEHVVQPRCLLRQARALLKPGGIIVIGTADTDAWSWRLQQNRYWYCSMPEHVSFFCETALNHIAAELGMRSIAHRRLSHIRANPWRRLRKSARNVIFEMARRARGFGVPPLDRSLNTRAAPGWLTARDHMLHVMRRA